LASIPVAQDVRDYLEGITTADVSDTWIEKSRDFEVIPAIEHWAQLSLSSQESKTDYFSGTGSPVLILDSKNIVSVESYSYIGIDPDTPITSTTGFEFIQKEGIIRKISGGFPKGNKNIKVNYTIGFATGNLPNDLSRLIVLMLADMVLGKKAGVDGGGTSLSVVAWSKSYGKKGKYSEQRSDIARSVIHIIKRYMSAVVGS
jgi:hypothetical protein